MYPGEKDHTEYLKYVERYSLGEETGRKLSKEEWLKRRKQAKGSKNVAARVKHSQ